VHKQQTNSKRTGFISRAYRGKTKDFGVIDFPLTTFIQLVFAYLFISQPYSLVRSCFHQKPRR
jgi:hypothetical protein